MDMSETKKGLHVPHSSKKEIFRVAIILTILTGLEFLVAFTMPDSSQPWRTVIFLVLTIMKAFYIVAYFMHLKHEKINLIYTILIPLIFIVYMVALVIYEGAKF